MRRPHHPERLIDLAPVGINHADLTGICTWVNQRWSELTGVEHGDACGRPWVDALHEDDRDPVLDQWLEAVARGLEFVCDVRARAGRRRDAGGHAPLGVRARLARHRVQAALSEAYSLTGEPFTTTVSIGVAVYPDHAGDAAGLVEAADASMYASKRAGRGRISSAGAHADAA